MTKKKARDSTLSAVKKTQSRRWQRPALAVPSPPPSARFFCPIALVMAAVAPDDGKRSPWHERGVEPREIECFPGVGWGGVGWWDGMSKGRGGRSPCWLRCCGASMPMTLESRRVPAQASAQKAIHRAKTISPLPHPSRDALHVQRGERTRRSEPGPSVSFQNAEPRFSG